MVGLRRAIAICLVLIQVMIIEKPTRVVSSEPDDTLDFDRQMAPLLAARCLECHNSVDRKGDLDLSLSTSALRSVDPVIVPGKWDESLIWRQIDQEVMPPKHPLSAAEKELFRRWLLSGARWGSVDPIDRFAYTSDVRAGRDWWSLQPVVRPKAPIDAIHPIDAFVLEKLQSRKLGFSRPADRRTLIRRVTFDLIGLPPTPEEIAAFEADPSPDAYERLVDRLLASQQYGPRWARHWLDVARYTESQGFEYDRFRPNAWHYRDYVINAFNDDKPYDLFVKEQIAGDVENFVDSNQPASSEGIVATSLLVCGPYDQAGNAQANVTQKMITREEELEDIVSVVGQTFLGLTVNCARCHSHKFDPISQEDYYSFKAVFEGVKHGERSIASVAEVEARNAEKKRLEGQRQEWEKSVSDLLAIGRKRAVDRSMPPKERSRIAVPAPIARWTFDDGPRDTLGQMHGELLGGARLVDGRLRVDGKNQWMRTAPLDKNVTEKTLEAWVALKTLQQSGGGVVSLESSNGSIFDAIVYGERKPLLWMAGSNNFVRTKDVQGPSESASIGEGVHLCIVYKKNLITLYRNGVRYGEPYRVTTLPTFTVGDGRVLLGLRHTGAGNGFLQADIDSAALYDYPLSDAEIGECFAAGQNDVFFLTQQQVLEELTAEERLSLQKAESNSAELENRIKKLPPVQLSYVGTRQQPQPTRRLIRGDVKTPAETVRPRGLSAIGKPPSDFVMAEDAPESERRVRLARWLADSKHPLTARVMVNRLWHYHFGRGIVETPNDFGFNGARPTHPELLDWLAAEFVDPQVESGAATRPWSLKHMHRLIVTSTAYRQASDGNEAAMAIDSENSLLWRFTPRRLEGEVTRDAMLAVSGQLNLEMGGPSFKPFIITNFNSDFYQPIDPEGAEYNRRTIYRAHVNSGKSSMMDALDCPDPSIKTPARRVTTTPIAALALMNNSFVLRQSKWMAERFRQQCANLAEEVRVAGEIDLAFVTCFGRSASPVELRESERLIEQHGLDALTWSLLNATEFMVVR